MIIIETKPEGGMVTFDDGDTCLAPCSTRVKRSRQISFAVERGDCRKTEKNIPPLIDHGFGAFCLLCQYGIRSIVVACWGFSYIGTISWALVAWTRA